MKTVALAIAVNLVSLACVIVAGVLAVRGLQGWGWFLVVAAFAATSVSVKSDGD